MPSKRSLPFTLDDAYKTSYEVEDERIVMVTANPFDWSDSAGARLSERSERWSEIKHCVRDIILVASILGLTVFGIAGIYEHSGRHQAITCQEGC